MIEQTLFYIAAAVLVFAASAVITVRNPVVAALTLVLCFFCNAAIWLLLEAEFLAIVLVLVYVGAVMVLFLFVVMMLDINIAELRKGFSGFLPIGVTVALIMVISMVLVLASGYFAGPEYVPLKHAAEYSNTRELGLLLYSEYLYPFEIAGAILLVAIVAAIALTHRRAKNNKSPAPGTQVAVKREDRIRLVKMKTEQQS
ncbi:MAG: NADH-quinone oxidoreductase subunit J [Gammaproteobacteria bacterium]|jgi:NADH-quinone oxidoreductase subunit J|nr:MAG: NADH-quinone oxidoreductase subunit J [Gammaproteobacteria bacterium]